MLYFSLFIVFLPLFAVCFLEAYDHSFYKYYAKEVIVIDKINNYIEMRRYQTKVKAITALIGCLFVIITGLLNYYEPAIMLFFSKFI